MISALSAFFVAMLTATVAENVLFSRALLPGNIHRLESGRGLWTFCGLLTAVNALSAVLCYMSNRLLLRTAAASELRAIAFLLCISIVYQAACAAMSRKLPEFYEKNKLAFLQATFNSAVLGSLLISATYGYGFFGYIGYALGAGLGQTAALAIVAMGTEYLQISHIPATFKGLPITLLYVGIISLAIYGLIGHQLPM